MTQEDKFAEERKRNKVAYAIEDFYDSISDLRCVWIGNITLAAFIGVAIIFGSDNVFHVIAALITAAFVFGIQRYAMLAERNNILGVIALYVIGVIVEYVVGGLPEPIIPFLTVEEGWVGFVPFANSASPILYFTIRLVLVYALINVYRCRKKLGEQPMATVRQLDRELAMRLE